MPLATALHRWFQSKHFLSGSPALPLLLPLLGALFACRRAADPRIQRQREREREARKAAKESKVRLL